MLSALLNVLKSYVNSPWLENMNIVTTTYFFNQANKFLLVFITMLLLLFTLPVYAEGNNVSDHTGIKKSQTHIQQKKNVTTYSTNINQTLSSLTKTSGSTDGNGKSYMLQLFSGLILVLLSIVVLAWVVKRFNRLQPSGNTSLQIIGGISMGARERVVVVQAGTTKVLLGVSPGRINMLHVLEEKGSINQRDDEYHADLSDDPDITTDLSIADTETDKTRTFSQNLAAALFRKKHEDK